MARHKHADLMIAKANDADLVIQYKCYDGTWEDVDYPKFCEYSEYRIKPELPKYRVALMKDVRASTGVDTYIATTEGRFSKDIEQDPEFLCWLTNWRPYEVGITELGNQ